MSLLITADSQYLQAEGGSFGSSTGDYSLLAWVKFTTGDSPTYQSVAQIGDDVSINGDSILLGNQLGYLDSFVYPANVPYRPQSNTQILNNTVWQMMLMVVDGGSVIKFYHGKAGDGAVAAIANAQASITESVGSGVSAVRIGNGWSQSWYMRGRVAHVAGWDYALTAGDAAALFNGGAGGNGASPTTIQASNLKFYMALTDDITTVHTGGVSMTATGSPSYDASNPTVDSPGGGGSTAIAPILSGLRSQSRIFG